MPPPSQPAAHASLPGLHSPAAGFDQPFEMLAACHERVQRSLDRLTRLVDHLQRRADGAPVDRVDADARSAADFVAVHAGHLPLEDGLAFPAARAATDADAQAAMGRERAARRQAASATPPRRA